MDRQRRNRLHRLVLSLSGAHEEVLEFVPSERIRFESLGWVILVTSGIAVVSMWFALADALGVNGIIALPLAFAWGLVIMGIDRWLIVSMSVDGGRKFAMAVPRLALAFLLGTLISTPLVLRIFQSEINAQISTMQQQNYNIFLQDQQSSQVAKQVTTYSSEMNELYSVISSRGASTLNIPSDPELVAYNSQLSSLNTELTHWTGLKSQYYTAYACQLYGGSACPRVGYGPAAAAASQQNYADALKQVSTIEGEVNQVQRQISQRDAELNSTSNASEAARYQEAETQLPTVRSQYETAVQRQNGLQATFYATNQADHGLLTRLAALSQLSDGDQSVAGARILLFLLFLVIECLPVTVKLLQRPGMYEQALQHARNAERRDFSKFYSFPSRIASPYGTSAQRLGAGYRLDEVWTPVRSLPKGDQPAMTVDESRNGAADRWLSRRPRQSADDDEPTGVTPPDVHGAANPVPAPDEIRTGREQVPEPSPDGGGVPLSWDEDE
jgi:hypothetical protein